MDIIIRNVEEVDGRYKIMSSDGHGGFWKIDKGSAEVISNSDRAVVIPKIAEVIDQMISDYLEIQEGYIMNSKYQKDHDDCDQRIIALEEVKDRLSNFSE